MLVTHNLYHFPEFDKTLCFFSFQHYLPDDDPSQLTAEAITLFLDEVLAGTAPVYGGSSYTVR